MIFFWSSSADNLVLSEHDLVLAVVKHDDTSESMENGISEDGILPASEGIVHKSYLTLKTISFTYGITEIRRAFLNHVLRSRTSKQPYWYIISEKERKFS